MKLLFLLLSIIGFVYAQELDELLNTYTNNSDLSEKTKLENGGTVTIFTRKDLERMQVNTLKDLLKSHPVLRYKESRSAIADMMYSGTKALSSSSNVRVYIDNQELTSATFGSGFVMAGLLNINFVDHVEIYTQSASYEFSTEPTYLLIKLYSKVAQRDRGNELKLSLGSRGFNKESIFNAQEYENFSYVAFASHNDDKKEVYESHGVPIQRDNKTNLLFATLYTDEHKLQLMALKTDLDMSIALSPRATYDHPVAYYQYFHAGYDTNYFDNTFFTIYFQHTDMGGHNKESLGFESALSPEIEFERYEDILSMELKHKIETENNRLMFGAKIRQKYFKTKKLKFFNFTIAPKEYDEQKIYSIFAENRYSISDNNIISLAAQYSRVINNAYIDNADIFQFRLSNTYIYNDFIFKTSLFRVESPIEAYIYVDSPIKSSLEPQKLEALSEEIKYEYDKSVLKLVLEYNHVNNKIMPLQTGGYVNNTETIKNISGYLEHTYMYDTDNKIISNISYSKETQYSKKELAAFVRVLNTVSKFDIFNELVYNRNNINHNHYYDYSAGVKYRYTKDLTLSVKGENIFDKAYEDSYYRIDPDTLVEEEPLMISPIEQRLLFTVEYLF